MTSFAEWAALVLGVVCVALGAVRSVGTFPTAIGSVALIGVLAARQKLYSDATLQVFYVAANLYGWVNWVRSRGRAGDVAVATMRPAERWRWAAGTVVLWVLWGAGMARFTDAAWPWWDAAVTVASMAAQLMMARRWWENWLVWIAVDLAAVPLYALKGLGTVAALYVAYLALSAWGLASWRRVRQSGTA